MSKPQSGKCPQCERVQRIVWPRSEDAPTLRPHMWRPQGPRGPLAPCPGEGRRPVKGTWK